MSLYDKCEIWTEQGTGDNIGMFDYVDVKQAVNELHSRLRLKANKQQCLTHDDIRDIFGEFKDE